NNYSDPKLCVGSLQEIPFADNTFDLIMTSHALEPNGGDEQKILQELFRVSADVVALFEPSYEFADERGKQRMTEKGYIKHLDQVAESVGFEVLYYQKLTTAINPQNPTAALILRKPQTENITLPTEKYACPRTKTALKAQEGGYFSEDSFLFYPVVSGTPILRSAHGVLASGMYK
ncbi:MAG: class I SAM-dependent methyltransferase, partial [Bacteroidota bacterium]